MIVITEAPDAWRPTTSRPLGLGGTRLLAPTIDIADQSAAGGRGRW
jgi:hypothetical protein